MKGLDRGPIFLVGAARSGTTLLQYMLRSHPRISLPTGESHFIVPMGEQAAVFGDLSRLENIITVLETIFRRHKEFLVEELHGIHFDVRMIATALHRRGVRDMPSLIDGLFRLNAEGEGKVRWGDKTPYYAMHLERLLSMFPTAQVVHIVRDGRDCALSMLERKYDLNIFNIHEAAETWLRYVRAAREFGRRVKENQYFEFRYEDLLTDPESTMRNICTFLGEDYSESVVNFCKPSEPGKTPLLQKPVQPQNSDKWREKMSDWHKRIFESVSREVLCESGYSLSMSAPQPPLFGIVSTAYKAHSWLMHLRNS